MSNMRNCLKQEETMSGSRLVEGLLLLLLVVMEGGVQTPESGSVTLKVYDDGETGATSANDARRK